MRLSAEEVTKLKERKLHKVERLEEPKHADVGKCYSADGEKYTIKAHKRLPRSAVASKALKEAWPPDISEMWIIELENGDHTTKERYLAAGAPTASICQAIYKWPDGVRRRCGRGFPDRATTCSKGHRRPPTTPEEVGYTHVPSRSLRGEQAAVGADEQEAFAKTAEEDALQKRKARRKQPGTYRA
jgi:hypothetical protein